MKKAPSLSLWVSLLLCSTISLFLTSCHYQDVLSEEEDMENGKTFSLEQGQVKYAEGIQFYFADYGKKQRIDFLKQEVLGKDTVPYKVDVHLIFRDNMLYLASKELGYCMFVEPVETFELMAVRIEEYRLFGEYEVTNIHLKPLGDLEVQQIYDKDTKYRVTCYGRVLMTEQRYESGIFEKRYEAMIHNLNVQQFMSPIEKVSDASDADPFDLSSYIPFDIWELEEHGDWSSKAVAFYELYTYLFSNVHVD